MEGLPEHRPHSQLSSMLEEILIAGSPRSSLGGRRSSGVRPVRVTTDDEGRSLLPPGERADGHDTSQPPSAKTEAHSKWGAHASDGKSTPGAHPHSKSSRPSPRQSFGGERKRSEDDRSELTPCITRFNCLDRPVLSSNSHKHNSDSVHGMAELVHMVYLV